MSRRLLLSLVLLVSFLASVPAVAQVQVSAECQWYTSLEFNAHCDDFSFYGYCEAGVNASCEAECTEFSFSVDCTASCEASCQTLECDVDPGSFDCNAYCEGECGAHCSGECGTTADSAYCEGECAAYCEGECGATCDITAPDIDCTGGCTASCEGSCQAEAEFDCHMGCEIDAYLDCEVSAQADCDASWDADGVLVCNGDVVDGVDWESAMQWLQDHGVEITYEGEADCSNGECHAEGSATLSCKAVAPGAESSKPSLVATLLSLLQ